MVSDRTDHDPVARARGGDDEESAVPMSRPVPRGFEIQGHRGARGLFPENTVEGFRAVIGLGVRILELDVAVTSDGVPVIFHDVGLSPDIVRDPGGAWIATGTPILNLSHAELSAYDVGRLRPGSAYAARYPDQSPHDGARIPALADVLRITVPAGVRVDAELKTLPDAPGLTVSPDAMAERVLAVAAICGATALLDMRSFDWRGLRATAARDPAIPLTFLTSPKTQADPDLWWGRPLDGSVPRTIAGERPAATWAPELGSLDRAAIDEAHALGLRVVPWTVNAPDDMRRMIAWGADGFCTDRPDIAFAVGRG
jgi:glycerophosphoryl diester phosphodiesterase